MTPTGATPGERTVGVISDTHGLLRPEAEAALEGSELILHAGDVGGPEILERLEQIAPVRAIRGNTDGGAWARSIPDTDLVSLSSGDDGPWAYLVHDIDTLNLDPEAAGVDVVVYGHSHRPSVERLGSVLYFNPGAAGRRRFRLPVTVGHLTVSADGVLEPTVVDLDVEG